MYVFKKNTILGEEKIANVAKVEAGRPVRKLCHSQVKDDVGLKQSGNSQDGRKWQTGECPEYVRLARWIRLMLSKTSKFVA